MSAPVLETVDLCKAYRLPRERLFQSARTQPALRGVSLRVDAGQSLGVVGESGSGKSTLARLAAALEPPTSGSVRWSGTDPHTLDPDALRRARRNVQMVFQDPYGSLDPRCRIGRSVAEPLASAERRTAADRVTEALEAVGLRAGDAQRFPHEFSGGQRQRVAIARALITRPRLIVADEPVSALDVSVQAQVLNLMADLQAHYALTYLFISHDLAVVRHVCDQVTVIYAGRVVEQGPAAQLFERAAHPYTRALIHSASPPGRLARPVPTAAAPAPGARGVPESTRGAHTGCAYAPRCPHVQQRCLVEPPALRPVGPGRQAACHAAESVLNDSHGMSRP